MTHGLPPSLVSTSRLYQAEREVGRLRSRVAVLEEEVLQLREKLRGESYMRWLALGLGKTHARLFDVLMRSPIGLRRRLEGCLSPDSGPKTLNVHICKMRPILAPQGIVIDTVFDTGYALPAQSKQRALALVDAAPSITPEAAP